MPNLVAGSGPVPSVAEGFALGTIVSIACELLTGHPDRCAAFGPLLAEWLPSTDPYPEPRSPADLDAAFVPRHPQALVSPYVLPALR